MIHLNLFKNLLKLKGALDQVLATKAASLNEKQKLKGLITFELWAHKSFGSYTWFSNHWDHYFLNLKFWHLTDDHLVCCVVKEL